jgi:hypothetical protein
MPGSEVVEPPQKPYPSDDDLDKIVGGPVATYIGRERKTR